MRIRRARPDDAPAIASIYAPFVRDTAITFETEVLSAEDIGARMRGDGPLYPWFVAEGEDGRVLGYAYATRFRARNAYRFAVETTVYVDPVAHGRGLGKALYQKLLATLEKQGFTQAIAAIALPNTASIKLHEAMGFVAAGIYRDVGYKLDEWHDVGIWQRQLASSQVPPREPLHYTQVED